jgi:hypothetical protein
MEGAIALSLQERQSCADLMIIRSKTVLEGAKQDPSVSICTCTPCLLSTGKEMPDSQQKTLLPGLTVSTWTKEKASWEPDHTALGFVGSLWLPSLHAPSGIWLFH